ncbi:MAG: histidine phosphatase family protein [bacterium]
MSKKSGYPELLVFVRHGESERNRIKRGVFYKDEAERAPLRGVPDHRIGLSEFGVEQSVKTGIGLANDFGRPDFAFYSGYLRVRETMEHALAAYSEKQLRKIERREHPFLVERNPGYGYDMMKAEADGHFPYIDEFWKTFGHFLSTPIGGESLQAVQIRAYLFLDEMLKFYVGEKVFVFAHSGTIRCLASLLEGWSIHDERWDPKNGSGNCGVTAYGFSKRTGRPKLLVNNRIYWK